MNTRLLIPIVALLIAPVFGLAAKPGKGKKKGAHTGASLAESLKPFDANGNHQIDGDEIAAVKKAFAESPKGALASLDKNANGQLEDTELPTAQSVASTDRGAKPGRALKQADKNGNQKIDPEEVEGLRKTFEADPKGALAKLDHDSNGKLDDKEIARMNKRLEKGGRASKGTASPSTTPSAATPKPEEAAKPAETVKPAEKTEAGK